jgi:hypothetical protein
VAERGNTQNQALLGIETELAARTGPITGEKASTVHPVANDVYSMKPRYKVQHCASQRIGNCNHRGSLPKCPTNLWPYGGEAWERMDVSAAGGDHNGYAETLANQHCCQPIWKYVVRVNAVKLMLVVKFASRS